jgi:hypothetical protein
MAEITLADQIKAMERVVARCKRFDPSIFNILRDSMGDDAINKVLSDIVAEDAALEAALATLKRLQWESEACPDDCDHTIAEHVAFDAGVEGGERGDDEDAGPSGPDDLREAWLAGHSVGSINRENSNESTGNNRD